MPRASTETLLPLDTFAAILGASPAHFATVAGSTYFPVEGSCSDIMFQYSWQSGDKTSREELAHAIARSEHDLAATLGFPIAPQWQVAEEHEFPEYRTAGVWRQTGWDSKGYDVGLKANYGKVLTTGRRAVDFVGVGAVVLSDTDGDGLSETATVTVATTLTDLAELKVYFVGYGADPTWEVRPARAKSASGALFTATFYVWQLVNPVLWEAFPQTTALAAINIMLATNFVTTVNVYRDYVDSTQASCQFAWEPSGCAGCADDTQDGCLHIRDKALGLVTPTPATYDATNGWTFSTFAEDRDPDKVRLWYQAGDVEPRYTAGYAYEPMPVRWQQAVAWMAAARLERPICACGNLEAVFADLRIDLAHSSQAGAFQLMPDDLNNPFGTRKGEVMAWRIVRAMQGPQEYIRHVAAI